MLVSRQPDTEQSHWSFSKFGTSYQKPSTSSPRMSNHFDTPLSTGSDWQAQYSYLPPSENNNLFSQSFESGNDNAEAAQPRSAAPAPATSAPSNTGSQLDVGVKEEPHTSPVGHRRSLDPLGLRSAKQPSPISEHVEAQNDQYSQKPVESAPLEGPLQMEPQAPQDVMNAPPAAPGANGEDMPGAHGTNPDGSAIKDEDDDVVDDDEMMEGGGEGESNQPQTAAERTAQRRKMKRFRLTHQQTRFLMSEFAKQPHPDAAHRERLSREIPGLSPRQVQVWFQNRRAKIKRLTADDRDRMIKMRAVPEDFDNVSALHSPYGAVRGLGTPISSPVDFSTPSYADHMMRGPLMVDVRRAEGDSHLSPTGLSPAFGNIGFGSSGTMSNPDILSPLSPTSNDRYGYGSHLSTPLSAGSCSTSNPFGSRHNSMDTSSMQMQNRQNIRPLQPLHLRDSMSRSRSDNLQSPLRSSMSWKGDSIDYSNYQAQHSSPQIGGPTTSTYGQEQMGITATTMGYDSTTYATSAVHSPTGMNYNSNMQSSSSLQNRNNPRLRAASATLPLGLDLRNQQYRPVNSSLQSPGATNNTPRATSSQYSSTSYSNSFPSAPLTAPVDFSLPRTNSNSSTSNNTHGSSNLRSGVQDYSMPQMSAPIAPPNDFSQAFQASMASPTSRTPMRDSFGGGGGPLGIQQPGGSQDHHHGSRDHHHSGSPYDDMGPGSLKRKSSFVSGSGSSIPTSTAGSQHAYGSTA